MVANTDPIPNLEVFVTAFERLTGGRPGLEMGDFEGFYRDGFRRTRAATGRIAEMIEAVRILKDKGYRLVLATNPLFPRIAIDDRIAWAGLERNDFAYVSSFEENCYCKPQPLYYVELLEILGLDGRECLMVGNHEVEDLVASTLGFGTYLVTDDLIEDPEGRFVPDGRGSSSDFLAFVREMPAAR